MIKPAITQPVRQALAVWHDEINGELAEEQKAKPSQETDLQVTSAAHDVLSASERDLRRALDTFSKFAPAISVRLSFVQGAADEARRARDKARATLANTNRRISELKTALAQLDVLLVTDEAVAA
jgi:hypothetical protein